MTSRSPAREFLLLEYAHGAVVVLHDITELRRADQIRRDFVANVSHELGTPLTAIRGSPPATPAALCMRWPEISRPASRAGGSASR